METELLPPMQQDGGVPIPPPDQGAPAAPGAPTPGYGTAAAFDTASLAGKPYQTYNEPNPMADPNMVKNLAAAQAAVTAALRFQGARAFSEDMQKGLPPDQALLKNGQNMFFADPKSFVTALQHFRPPTPPRVQDFGPGVGPAVVDSKGAVKFPPASAVPPGDIMGEPIIDRETGIPLPGTHAVRGKGGALHMVRDSNPTGEGKLSMVDRERLKDARSDLKAAVAELPPAAHPNYKSALAEVNKIKSKIKSIYEKGAPAEAKSKVVLIRNKKTGKIHPYSGDPEDVKDHKDWELAPDQEQE